MLWQGSVHPKKKEKNPTWIRLKNWILVQGRPLLVRSSVVNCLCMSQWASNLTHCFVANRERGMSQGRALSLLFSLYPGVIGSPVLWLFSTEQESTLPVSSTAGESPRGSCSHAVDKGVKQQHQGHFNNLPLSIWASLPMRCKWEPYPHLRATWSSDPALFQGPGSDGDGQTALPLLKVGAWEPPTPVKRQRAVHLLIAPLFVRTTAYL